jgi:hypothetical protein
MVRTLVVLIAVICMYARANAGDSPSEILRDIIGIWKSTDTDDFVIADIESNSKLSFHGSDGTRCTFSDVRIVNGRIRSRIRCIVGSRELLGTSRITFARIGKAVLMTIAADYREFYNNGQSEEGPEDLLYAPAVITHIKVVRVK